MRCNIIDYLKEIGHVPLDLEDIEPGMQICYNHQRAFKYKVVSVKGNIIHLDHGKKIKFLERDIYRYVD